MNHLSERTLVELRDGLPVDAELRIHLDDCANCRGSLSEVEARSATIDRALARLDEPIDAAAAKERVRARLADSGSGSQAAPSTAARAGFSGWSLGKAAALLLLAAGAASALPGSPVRGWLTQQTGEGGSANRVESVETGEPGKAVEPVGGRLTVTSGPLAVTLAEVPSGTRVEVRWVGGSAVTVQAAPGSGFRYAEGEVHATVVGGPVSVEIPRGITRVSLVVNGRTYLSRGEDGLETPGPVTERGEDVMTFIVPQ